MLAIRQNQVIAAEIAYTNLPASVPLLNLRDRLRSLRNAEVKFISLASTLYVVLEGDVSEQELAFVTRLVGAHIADATATQH